MSIGEGRKIRSGVKVWGKKGRSRYGFGERKVVVDVQVIIRLLRVAELDSIHQVSNELSGNANEPAVRDQVSSNIETTHFIPRSPY